MLRNFIEISGITPESHLPDKVKGQLLEYSEVEHFYIPEDKPGMKDIYQISVKVDLISTRIINASLGKIVIIDGVKRIKIIYTDCTQKETASIVDVELPFNTFIDIPKGVSDIEHVNIYIADAYFKAIDNRKLYSFILYIIDVGYDQFFLVHNEIRNPIDTNKNENAPPVNSSERIFRKEPEIKITSQVLSEMTLSKISDNAESNSCDLLVDIDSEYL